MPDRLKTLYNACAPMKPASPAYYVDCSDVRGSTALCLTFRNHLRQCEDHFLRFLFSGHIGCGKSSELAHLAHVIEDPNPKSPYKRYFPVVVDAQDYLDEYDVTPTDILLAIVTEVASTLREKGIGELADSYMVRRLAEMKDLLLTEVGAEGADFDLGAVKTGIRLLKRNPEARKRVREKLRPQTSSFLAEVNVVFEEARILLRKKQTPKGEAPYVDLVLILDNLEKIQRFEGFGEGLPSHRELFVERARQLTGLEAHVVYTVPLSLVIAEGKKLGALYGTDPFVLPMVKIAERDPEKPYPPGRARVRELIQRRAPDNPLVPELFEDEALDWLIRYSGGHLRDLMQFIQESVTYVEEPPITLSAAKRALGQTVALYSRSIRDSYWMKLAEVEVHPDKRIDLADADYQTMLEQLIVLEYVNGGNESDSFNPCAPWYGVNPIVRELRPFKRAVEALRASKPKEPGIF